MSASSELAEYLEDESVGTVGTDIFVDKRPALVNVMVIAQYPGRAPEHRMDGTRVIRFEFPRVQVTVRDTDDETAFTKAEAAAAALGKVANQMIENVYYRSVNVISQPGIQGRDENDVIIVVFNAEAERRIP